MNSTLQLSDEVAQALAAGRPVVALESTIISHGLPRSRNHATAIEFESILRVAGVTPATIAVLDGVPRIGLDAECVRRIADDDLAKAGVRDLPILAARGASGATTVAATAGIRVFATGDLGGVHRGASETFNESADLFNPCRHTGHSGVGGREERARHRSDPQTASDLLGALDRAGHDDVFEPLRARHSRA